MKCFTLLALDHSKVFFRNVCITSAIFGASLPNLTRIGRRSYICLQDLPPTSDYIQNKKLENLTDVCQQFTDLSDFIHKLLCRISKALMRVIISEKFNSKKIKLDLFQK